MATTTTRLGLRKPASSDNVSVGTDLDNNFDAIDAVVGLTDCTSTTRPSTPFKNQLIRESDTGSYYVSNGTAPASGSWLPVVSTEGPTTVGPVGAAAPLRMQTISTLAGNRLMEGRRPSEANAGYVLDFDGRMQWGVGGSTATDTELYRVSAGALGIKGGAALGCFVGSAGQITNPYADQLRLDPTDKLLYRYTGSTWIPVVSTGATESGARYTNNGVGLPTVAASGGNSIVPFNNPQATSSYITASGTNNTTFTINRTGWCTYSSGVRWKNDVAVAGGGSDWFFRAVLVAGAVDLMGKTEKAPVSYGANTVFISTLTDTRYFNAGDQLQFSFSNGTNQTATLVSASELINCSFRWGGS